MPFNLSDYAAKVPELAGKTFNEVAQHAFDQHGLAGKYGYKDANEWLNDPGNAHNLQAIAEDRQARPDVYAAYDSNVAAKAAYDAAPERGNLNDFGANFRNSLLENVAGNTPKAVAGGLNALGDYTGVEAFNKMGKGVHDWSKGTDEFMRGSGLMAAPSKSDLDGGSIGGQIGGLVGGLAGDTAKAIALGGATGLGVGKAFTYGVPGFHALDRYDSVRQQSLDAVKTLPEARANATTNAAVDYAFNAGTNVALGNVGGKLLKPLAGEVTSSVTKLFGGGFGEMAKDFATHGGVIAGSSLGNGYLQAEFLHQQGLSKETGIEYVSKNFGSLVLPFILGAIPAIGGNLARSGKANVLSRGVSDPVARQSVSNEVYQTLAKTGNHEAAAAWDSAAREAIANKADIDLGDFTKTPLLTGELLPPDAKAAAAAPSEVHEGEFTITEDGAAKPGDPAALPAGALEGELLAPDRDGAGPKPPGAAEVYDAEFTDDSNDHFTFDDQTKLPPGFDHKKALSDAKTYLADVTSRSADPTKDSDVVSAQHWVELAQRFHDEAEAANPTGGTPAIDRGPAMPMGTDASGPARVFGQNGEVSTDPLALPERPSAIPQGASEAPPIPAISDRFSPIPVGPAAEAPVAAGPAPSGGVGTIPEGGGGNGLQAQTQTRPAKTQVASSSPVGTRRPLFDENNKLVPPGDGEYIDSATHEVVRMHDPAPVVAARKESISSLTVRLRDAEARSASLERQYNAVRAWNANDKSNALEPKHVKALGDKFRSAKRTAERTRQRLREARASDSSAEPSPPQDNLGPDYEDHGSTPPALVKNLAPHTPVYNNIDGEYHPLPVHREQNPDMPAPGKSVVRTPSFSGPVVAGRVANHVEVVEPSTGARKTVSAKTGKEITFTNDNGVVPADHTKTYGKTPEDAAGALALRAQNMAAGRDRSAVNKARANPENHITQKAFDLVKEKVGQAAGDKGDIVEFNELGQSLFAASREVAESKLALSKARDSGDAVAIKSAEAAVRFASSVHGIFAAEHSAALANMKSHGFYFPDRPGYIDPATGSSLKIVTRKVRGRESFDPITRKPVRSADSTQQIIRVWSDPSKPGNFVEFLVDPNKTSEGTFPATIKGLDDKIARIKEEGTSAASNVPETPASDSISAFPEHEIVAPKSKSLGMTVKNPEFDSELGYGDKTTNRLAELESKLESAKTPEEIASIKDRIEVLNKKLIQEATNEAAARPTEKWDFEDDGVTSKFGEDRAVSKKKQDRIDNYDKDLDGTTKALQAIDKQLASYPPGADTSNLDATRYIYERRLAAIKQFGSKNFEAIEKSRFHSNKVAGDFSGQIDSVADRSAKAPSTPEAPQTKPSGEAKPVGDFAAKDDYGKQEYQPASDKTAPIRDSRFYGEGRPESSIPEDLSLRSKENTTTQESKLSSDDTIHNDADPLSNHAFGDENTARGVPSEEGARTLLKHWDHRGDTDTRPLNHQELSKIFQKYPHLRNEFPHLSPRQSETAFGKGFLGINYAFRVAMKIAKTLFKELGNRMDASLVFVRTLDDISPRLQARLTASGISLDHVKSFYDPKNNRVISILDRHSGVVDLLKSVLHEGGHNAEKLMLGARANKFFSDMTVRMKSEIDSFMKKHGLADTAANRLKAAREVFYDQVGDLTFKGNGMQSSNSATLFQRFVAMVKDGIRSLGERFGIKALDLSYSKSEIETMAFRFVADSRTLQTDSTPISRAWDGFQSRIFDKFHEFAKLEKKWDTDVNSTFHGAMGQFKGRIADFINRDLHPHFKAFGKFAADSGLTVEQFDQYLYSKSAIERNEARAAAKPNDTVLASRVATENAAHAKVIADFDAKIGPNGVSKIAAAQGELRSMISKTLDRAVDTGFYTRAEADLIQKFQNYVTFKNGDSFSSQGHLNVDVKGTPLHRMGDYNGANADCVGSTINTIRSVVVAIEKNHALQHLNDFAFKNPLMNDFTVIKGTSASNPGVSIPAPPNSIGVRIKGQQFYMVFKNERALSALKSMDDATVLPFMQALQKYNRFRIKSDLALNPDFWIRNLVARDTVFGLANLYTRETVGNLSGAAVAGKVLLDLPSVAKGLYDINFRNGSAKWGDLYERYQKTGAKMGLAFMGNDTSFKHTFVNEFKLHGNDLSGSFRRAARAVNHWAERINDISENAVRLAAFKHATEAGLGDVEAGRLSKEIAINFDRIGSWGQAINSLYIYSNAYSQGLKTTAQMIQRNPKQFSKIALGLAGLGFGSAFMQRALFGSDYDKIPEHVRSANLVMMPGLPNSAYGKIALPGELLPFFNFGQGLADIADGRSISSTSLSFLSNAVQSLNPLGRVVLDGERTLGQSAAHVATPSAFRPIVESFIQTNEDGKHMKWSGTPMKPGTEAGYLLSSIAGGVGKLFSQTAKIVSGNAESVSDIPVVSAFVGTAPHYMSGEPTTSRYKEASSSFLSMYSRYAELETDAARKEFMASNPKSDIEIMEAAKGTDDKIRQLGAIKKRPGIDKKTAADVDKAIVEHQKYFLEFYKKKAQ